MIRSARRTSRRAGALAAILALGGCTVGPAYRRPEVDVPAAYRDQPVPASPSSYADLPWWSAFHDPALEALVREALAGNPDLAIAVARVEEARASAGIARADRFPAVAGDAGATRSRSSRELVAEGTRTSTDVRASIGASWELDLWGRVRRGEEAAFADYLASEEGRRAVVVTLVGDVAEAYFELRSLDLELEITQGTLATRRKTSDLFAKRLSGGVASSLETAQATADLAAAAAARPDVERRIAQQEHRLAALLGRAPSPIARGAPLGAIPLPTTAPAGWPASLLERRPDVRAAEARVRAANARVGVADANMLPRVSLSALLGLEAHDLADLGGERASFGALGAGLAAPVFQGGRLSEERCAAIARWEAAVAGYRKAVQGALRDVSDQLTAIGKFTEARVELEKVVASLEEALGLASTRYDNGASAYFEVLDAQRRLFGAQLLLAGARRDEHVAFVRLYRALGGGWDASSTGSGPAPAVAAPGAAAGTGP